MGGCYTYRARAVIKLLLRADRTPIDMGGHRTPTLALPRRRIYESFIPEACPLLITRDILMNLWKKRILRFYTRNTARAGRSRVGENAALSCRRRVFVVPSRSSKSLPLSRRDTSRSDHFCFFFLSAVFFHQRASTPRVCFINELFECFRWMKYIARGKRITCI